jgi:hypothetical protein
MNEESLNSFQEIISDFIGDLENTFPEYKSHWDIVRKSSTQQMVDYCKMIYPERFFDILYQNEEIFKPEESVNTYFLPSIDFKLIFNDETVSETSKKTVWKYLQLIMFSIVNDIKDKKDFGDCMNIFNGINEGDLEEQLKSTMENIGDFFKESNKTQEGDEEYPFSDSMPNMPDLESMKGHLHGLFNGKIGSLAKEMAEEITEDFVEFLGNDVDPNNLDQKDVMKKLMKNPKKIMELMKKVTSKLDEKIKSGNISKDEMMKEATELMGKMKEMGGGGQFNDLMKNLTKGMGLGKGAKFNKGAFDAMQKEYENKERLKEKIKQRKKATLEKKNEKESVFKIVDEEQEKSRIAVLDELIAEEEKEKLLKPKTTSKSKKKKKKTKN